MQCIWQKMANFDGYFGKIFRKPHINSTLFWYNVLSFKLL